MERTAVTRVAESAAKMPFTITRNLEQAPSHPRLWRLAENNRVHLTGNERNGSFSCRGVEGDYEFEEHGVHGKFAGRGLAGEFSFVLGKATVTITQKPLWLPATLLRQKITEWLDTFGNELG